MTRRKPIENPSGAYGGKHDESCLGIKFRNPHREQESLNTGGTQRLDKITVPRRVYSIDSVTTAIEVFVQRQRIGRTALIAVHRPEAPGVGVEVNPNTRLTEAHRAKRW